MADTTNLREVPLHAVSQPGKAIDFTIGFTSATTIRDEESIRPVAAGGYAYKGSGKVDSVTRNRFIYWQIRDNVLELTEQSLDVNLTGNTARIRFLDGLLLPSVSAFETLTSVCVLVATSNSVHRLTFPHPDKLYKHGFPLSSGEKTSVLSIFSDFEVRDLRSPWNFATFSQPCGTFAGWLCQDGHSLFALAAHMGGIVLIKLPPPSSEAEVEQFEFQQSGVMQRLWSGLVPTSLRASSPAADAAIGVCLHPVGRQMTVFTLCRDHKLRIWSCQSQECIFIKDLMEDIPDEIDMQSSLAQNHALKKVVNPATGQIYLGVFLSFAYHTQFCIYEVVNTGNSVELAQVSFLFSPRGNLVDFSITPNHIYTAWINTDEECEVYFASIEGSCADDVGWKQVHLQPAESADITVPAYMEPREFYLENLFYPGRFSNQTILKAIQIYQQLSTNRAGHHDDVSVSRDDLKHMVVDLIEAEIHQLAPGWEMLHDEYRDLQLGCCSKFYSYVVQYHQVGSKPMGIFVDNNTGLVCLLRKEMLSLLRPCDGIEELYLSPGNSDVQEIVMESFNVNDQSMRKHLAIIVNGTKSVASQLSAESLCAIKHDMEHQGDPAVTAHHIAISLIGSNSDESGSQGSSDLVQQLENSFQKLPGLLRGLEALLGALEVSEGPDGLVADEGWPGASRHQDFRRLFCSSFASSVLLASFRQLTCARMALCRDLLILLSLLDRLGARVGLDPRTSHDLCSSFIPRTVALLRIYHTLTWATEQMVTPAPANAVESNLKQLAALEITDGLQGKEVPEQPCLPLLELFLGGLGGSQMRAHLAASAHVSGELHDSDPVPFWTVILNQALHVITRLIWPAAPSLLFPEFLLSNCQYIQLQEYCHLIGHWCDVCKSSRQFLLGQSHLVLGEYRKALDCFLKAAEGVGSEDPEMKKLLQNHVTDHNQLVVLFYIKVMRLFEQFEAPDFVLLVANTTLSLAQAEDPNISKLWSNIFKHHLELGHTDEAYAAITANPDAARRKDCLHRFMVVLCERGQLQELCEYPYVNLQVEFEGIMESHARTVDIATHKFYDFLYAFHIFRGNYRKAGSVMYEFGMRLTLELPGRESLQKQAKCYLAAINALRLVDPENAWFVKPLEREEKDNEPPNMSPKRKQGEQDAWYTSGRPRTRRKVVVLEIGDLEREYLLVLARLQLLKADADPSRATGPPLSAAETVTLLVQAGLFDTAFTIAETFDLPKQNIFEGLASSRVPDAERWDWILANDTGGIHQSTDKSSASQAWQFLKYYLDKLGPRGGHAYYRCVTSKLISLGATLPTWLVNDHKRHHPAELLRLYVSYDLLPEAVTLAMEYIDAGLGTGKEYFGLKSVLHATDTSVCLPYTAIDHLLAALSEARDSSELAKMRDELLHKLENYRNVVITVSDDMTTAAWKRARRRMAAKDIPWQ